MKHLLVLFISSLLVQNIQSQTATEYTELGLANIILKDYLGAILDFNKAIELNPKIQLAYFGRGTAKIELKEYESAIF